MDSQSKSGPAKVVITRTDHGVSIKIQDTNPNTKYTSVDGHTVDKALSSGEQRVVIKKK